MTDIEDKSTNLDKAQSRVVQPDKAWLFPPLDVRNATAWDRYWKDQIAHDLGPNLFDIFCHDEILVRAALKYGLTTVLCVGNGISQEPVALSRAGFQVTALDISSVAITNCKSYAKKFKLTDHYFPRSLMRSGGSVQFIVGDFLDPEVCPGPYDIIVERRTIQDYPEAEQEKAIACLINRLAKKGIFFSHCHDAIRQPPDKPYHATKPLIEAHGIKLWKGVQPIELEGQVALLLTSTG